jgi:hypothetical protein
VILAVARRDPATAAAGIPGAVILGIIAILTGERRPIRLLKQTLKWFRTLAPASRRGLPAPNINKTRGF